MNEETIKELLEKLKQCDDFHNRCDFLMEHSEITYMLDYITNLQQENKELKLELSGYRQAILNDKEMLGLKEENQRLKKELEEYKLITIDYQELEARNQELKKVISKSIEYIGSNDIEVLKYHDIPSETTSYEIVTVDLLKILKDKFGGVM